jgi:hypothetical protein
MDMSVAITPARVTVHGCLLKVAGTLRVPSAVFRRCRRQAADGTRSVPATFRAVNGYRATQWSWRPANASALAGVPLER